MPLIAIRAPGQFRVDVTWTAETLQRGLLRNAHAFLNTQAVEQIAVTTRRARFSGPAVGLFVKAVCGWGNYPGVAGKVLGKGRLALVVSAFQAADACLTRNDPNQALMEVQRLYGLGRVSFASKHIRMLAPDKAVVLDSVISERLAYPLDATGYRSFLNDCILIRNDLNAAGAVNPVDLHGLWRVADVEMAIYSVLRGF